MENFKRSVKRFITRLVVLGLVVICGAIAIAQAQRDKSVANAANTAITASPLAPFHDAGAAIADTARTAVNATSNALKVPQQRFSTPQSSAVPRSSAVQSSPAQSSAALTDEPKTTAPQFTADQFSTDQRTVAASAATDANQDSFDLGDWGQVEPREAVSAPSKRQARIVADPQLRTVAVEEDVPDFGSRFSQGDGLDSSAVAAEVATLGEVSEQESPRFQEAASTNNEVRQAQALDPPPFYGNGLSNTQEKLPPNPAFDFQTQRAPQEQGGLTEVDSDQARTAAVNREFTNDSASEAPQFGGNFSNQFQATEPSENETTRFSGFGGNGQTDANRFSQPARNTLRNPEPEPEPVASGNAVGANSSTSGLRAASAAQVAPLRNVRPPAASTFDQSASASASAEYTTSATGDRGASEFAVNQLTGAGRPGPTEQEGPQNTGLTIHKIAPQNARVGQPATFEIKVRNNSQVPAENVLIRDEVPVGAQLVDTNPQAQAEANGGVFWEIGTLRPNEDAVVRMKITPLQEGMIGSVATVTYQALASAKATVTRPALKVTHSTKERVLIGDTVRFAITIENPGSGPATNVIIEEDVPPGLSHSKGPKLEYEVGTIPPGGQRRLELSLKAARAGLVENMIVARGSGDLLARHSLQLEVIAPELQVKVDGPSRRYLERKATYTVAIENPGTADAQNVEIVTQLPRGLKFVSTNNSGRYDPLTHSIKWTLATLPSRQFGTVQFTAIPVTKGDFNLAARAKADRGLADAKDHPITVEGLAALMFEVKDQVDPIDVGSETTYEIKVRNQGTEVAKNVHFVATVPPGMRAVAAEGPTKYQIRGNEIYFESIESLPAKSESTYSVRVEGVQANDHRFKVTMTSDALSSPVVEEESTRVLQD